MSFPKPPRHVVAGVSAAVTALASSAGVINNAPSPDDGGRRHRASSDVIRRDRTASERLSSADTGVYGEG